MSDWFTVTAHRLCMSPRNRESCGLFSSFFPNRRSHCANGTNSYLHLPSWKQLVITAVYLPFGVLFRFSSTHHRVFVMTLKSEGCRARALKSNDLTQFSSPPLTGAIRMIQLNSARFSRISRRLIFFRGSPWPSRGSREPRWTTNCVHLLRGGGKSDPL